MKIVSSYRGGCDAHGNALVTVETPAEIATALMAEWGGVVERNREWLKVVVGGRYLLWTPEQVEVIVDALSDRAIVDVGAIARWIMRPWKVSSDATDRQREAIIDDAADYFAPEDREVVRPIIAEALTLKLKIEGVK